MINYIKMYCVIVFEKRISFFLGFSFIDILYIVVLKKDQGLRCTITREFFISFWCSRTETMVFPFIGGVLGLPRNLLVYILPRIESCTILM